MLNRQQGSLLIEALVSILIFAFGFLALMGMQSASVSQAAQAKYRNDAAMLANQIIGQITADQGNLANYGDGETTPAKTAWLTQVANTLPGGGATIAVVDTQASPRTVTVTVTWQAPNEGAAHRFQSTTRIMPPCYDPITNSTACS